MYRHHIIFYWPYLAYFRVTHFTLIQPFSAYKTLNDSLFYHHGDANDLFCAGNAFFFTAAKRDFRT
ncbi:TPA_asm: hypothetical protein G1424_01570 [Salmonella enterica]|uniref:Uncharacterized protein n=3 Tax=Salmonella enterica TaxID=28901 RepID=A0A722K7N3_SALER|nr:hypothetical protein [Salmonella enterica]HAD9107082.1 hypothetical protein [Salmonella enterica]HAD9236308.1 hypothetical protein [Salmonella enterica]